METMRAEIELNIPARVGWNAFMSNETLNKVDRNKIENVEYTEGDGSSGTVRAFKAGPELQGVTKDGSVKFDKVEPGRSVSLQLTGGDLQRMYDPLCVILTFVPVSGNEEECIVEWKAEYKKVTPNTPSPEKLKRCNFSNSQVC